MAHKKFIEQISSWILYESKWHKVYLNQMDFHGLGEIYLFIVGHHDQSIIESSFITSLHK